MAERSKAKAATDECFVPLIVEDDAMAPPGSVADLAFDDGRQIHLRPIAPEDDAAYRDFAQHLSAEAIYYRFFSPRTTLTEGEIDHFLHVDRHDRLAIVALDGPTIVGVGRYDRLGQTPEAEVAFVVAEEYQGHGIAPMMLAVLRTAAHHEGLTRLVATVLPDNHKMLHVFVKSGWVTSRVFAEGVIEVAMSVSDESPGSVDEPSPT